METELFKDPVCLYEDAADLNKDTFGRTHIVFDECRGGAMCLLDDESNTIVRQEIGVETCDSVEDRINRSIAVKRNLFLEEWAPPVNIQKGVLY